MTVIATTSSRERVAAARTKAHRGDTDASYKYTTPRVSCQRFLLVHVRCRSPLFVTDDDFSSENPYKVHAPVRQRCFRIQGRWGVHNTQSARLGSRGSVSGRGAVSASRGHDPVPFSGGHAGSRHAASGPGEAVSSEHAACASGIACDADTIGGTGWSACENESN